MNKANLIYIVFLNFIVLSSFAGGGFTGKITYEIEYDLPEALEAQRSMLATEMTTIIGKKFSRTEQQTGMGNQITINDFKSGVTTLLLNIMGQKLAISNPASGTEEPDVDIKETGETKTIAGYECKKIVYIIKGEIADDDKEIELYYSPDLPQEANTQFPGLKGYPLEYTIEAQGMIMTYKASEIKQQKVNKKLGTIPDGYETKTMEEFKAMFGM